MEEASGLNKIHHGDLKGSGCMREMSEREPNRAMNDKLLRDIMR
jgi:hypothetical protein